MNRLRGYQKFLIVVIPSVLILYFGVIEIRHFIIYGHFVPYGLHVDALSKDGYIGIPGQKKLYWAEISNFTLWPVKIMACQYNTDIGPETEYPYAVQRWNPRTNQWDTIVEPYLDCFCQPSLQNTHIVIKYLWPGFSARVMTWEATGARVPFQKGDKARFIVYTKFGKKADRKTAIPSIPFSIEDEVIRDDGVSYRVKH